MKLKEMNKKTVKIKNEIGKIGKMRPGSLSKQYNVCGAQTCRCKNPKKPKKHGPYYKLSYVHQGKTKNQFIRENLAKEIENENEEYKKFKDLIQQWITLEIERSNLEMKIKIDEMKSK